MTLLHALVTLSQKHHWRIVVAHFNHQLRGRSSDADERLVHETSSRLGLTFVRGSADVKRVASKEGVSIEMAARRCRHEFFAREAGSRGLRRIVLAHHADDQVELFFLRLLRGAGSQGLGGMKDVAPSPWGSSVKLVRPLLMFSREEIVAFAHVSRIRFREDVSNVSTEFLRNRIRHDLLPLMRAQFQPALTKVVVRQMEILSAENDLLLMSAKRWLASSDVPFSKAAVALQRRVLQLQLENIPVSPEFELIESLRLNVGKVIAVSGGMTLRRDEAGRLHASRAVKEPESTGEKLIFLEARKGDGEFGGVSWKWTRTSRKARQMPEFRNETEWFDADRVGSQAVLRYWRPGDRFQPIGMKNSQKLQDIFTNLKVPRAERLRRLVATTADGVVWWVEGLRIGELFKLQPATRNCLRWSWRRH